jgi:hypothetical protein
MAKRVAIAFTKSELERLKQTSKLSGSSSLSEFVKKLVLDALGDGIYDKLTSIVNMYSSISNKVVTTIYLDDNTYNKLYELSTKYDIALSTLIRALSLYKLDHGGHSNDEVRIKVPKPNGLWAKYDFTELTAYLECKNGHRLLEIALGQDMYKAAKTLGQLKIRCAICGSNTLYIHIVVKDKREVVANAQA